MGIKLDEIEKYIRLINMVDRDKLQMLIEAAIGYLDDHLDEILDAIRCKAK